MQAVRRRLTGSGRGPKLFDGTINPLCLRFIEEVVSLIQPNINTQGIYRVPGDMASVRLTKEAMNRGKFHLRSGGFLILGIKGKKVDLSLLDVHTLCSLLKSFLKDLIDPILTFDLYPCFVAAVQQKKGNERRSVVTRLMHMLPKDNLAVFKIILIHLNEVSHQQDINLMGADNLAIVFGPILLRSRTVNAQTILADVPYVNGLIALMVGECDFFFRSKLVDMRKRDRRRSLFEELVREGMAEREKELSRSMRQLHYEGALKSRDKKKTKKKKKKRTNATSNTKDSESSASGKKTSTEGAEPMDSSNGHTRPEGNDSSSTEETESGKEDLNTEINLDEVEDETLKKRMKMTYKARRNHHLEKWTLRRKVSEEEMEKRMHDKAAKIENGEYSPNQLKEWLNELERED